MKYIAYGSNMIQDQMASRCPDAKFIGTGYLEGAQLEFYLHATVERSKIKGARVPVAVWEISKRDEQNLDMYEGYPNYYVKRYARVHMADGSKLTGMTYIMNRLRVSPPTSDYFYGIRRAYADLGLSSEINTILYSAYRRSLMRPA